MIRSSKIPGKNTKEKSSFLSALIAGATSAQSFEHNENNSRNLRVIVHNGAVNLAALNNKSCEPESPNS